MARRTMLVLVLAIGTAVYAYLIRPWFLRWGATDTELAREWPGDDLVPDATFGSTRSIIIDAPPELIWPWLVQIGQGRGGFYSYDGLENLFKLNIHSVDRIVPEFQQLKPGDVIAFAPDEAAGMIVVGIEPERALILQPLDPKTGTTIDPVGSWNSTWSFILDPKDEHTTRLVARSRARFERSPTGMLLTVLFGYVLEPIQFIMERKMLLDIRDRVES